MKLIRNMGTLDRIFRTMMGVAFIYFGPVSDLLITDGLSEALLALVGVLALVSALSGYCPVYHMANISSCRK
jgi:hypothetical protein